MNNRGYNGPFFVYGICMPTFIEKSNMIFDNFYDYSLVEYETSKLPVTIICPIHGQFTQTPYYHLKGKGCRSCKATSEFIETSNSKHSGQYDYSKVILNRVSDTVTIICPEHGEFTQTATVHKSGHGCSKCSDKNKGSVNKISLADFIAVSNKKHNNKYDYSKTNFNSLSDTVTIICPEHGEFTQLASSHKSGHGCSKCAYDHHGIEQTLTRQAFIDKSNLIHGGIYDYTNTEYTNGREMVGYKCHVHGDVTQLAYYHLNGSGCPQCTSMRSKMEIEIYNYCCSLVGSENVISNDRTVLGGKELDIYIPSMNIAIEYNGLYWHSSNDTATDGYSKVRHLDKTVQCEEKGIELLHIFEYESIDGWKSMIRNKLGNNKRIFARKCSVEYVTDNAEIRDFLVANHLQGHCNATYKIGLYCTDMFNSKHLIAIMTFGKSRYGNTAKYELLRFCTKQGITVVGGASKLLSAFRKDHRGTIVSYANKRWSNGNLYEQIGFTYSHTSAPCYWYISGKNIYHRSKFMKHKLSVLLKDYNPDTTEVKNMYNHGFRRIWDCGNKVYLLKELK